MSRISTQKSRREAMNRIPSTNCRPECPVASGTSAAGVGAKLAITRAMAMKPTAPAAKTAQVSASAITTPPSPGRTMREPCQSMEFSATALIICSRGIRLGKNACRLGKSRPATSAMAAAMARTCQTATTPVPSRAARRTRRPAMIEEVAISIRRRSTRSAMTPPTRAAAMVGIDEAAPRNPRWSGEPLSS